MITVKFIAALEKCVCCPMRVRVTRGGVSEPEVVVGFYTEHGLFEWTVDMNIVLRRSLAETARVPRLDELLSLEEFICLEIMAIVDWFITCQTV